MDDTIGGQQSTSTGSASPTADDLEKLESQTESAEVSDNERAGPTRQGDDDRRPLDWDGPDDPDDPHNWPLSKRITFGTSAIVGGIPQIMQQYHVSETASYLTVTIYILGPSLGPNLGAPISELFVSLCEALGCVGVQNVAEISYGAVCSATPDLGPVAGGWVATKKDWKWTQWVYLMLGEAVMIPLLFIKESYKPVILARRNKEARTASTGEAPSQSCGRDHADATGEDAVDRPGCVVAVHILGFCVCGAAGVF
ncbi:hypothetical protein V1520DRAFT_375669 [Lipomyces starkeyi]|uniref:Major facilitator superfamily (MFS) profile domain-containing protein n=1 Tax=Lipomyces starkeyi NRRL Y-11557 TaxID=675824 RepID=A0A1E3QC09_LIPST|nr:hypothetical protein LIPSTDRAFT_1940 [Lipomyces starkeyi NRRL Y-11557]